MNLGEFDIAQLPNPTKINSMIEVLGLIVTKHLHIAFVLIKYRLAISLYILSTL